MMYRILWCVVRRGICKVYICERIYRCTVSDGGCQYIYPLGQFALPKPCPPRTRPRFFICYYSYNDIAGTREIIRTVCFRCQRGYNLISGVPASRSPRPVRPTLKSSTFTIVVPRTPMNFSRLPVTLLPIILPCLFAVEPIGA